MRLREPTLEMLLREAEEARLREALLEATGEELLDRAKALARAVEERIRRVTAPRRPDGDRDGDAAGAGEECPGLPA